MSVKFSNNATTELASSIGTSDTSITVVDGSKFPILTAGDHTYVTLDTDTASPTREIVRVTAISGNVLTVTRGQDGTSPASFAAGTKVELRLTAALLNDVAGANPSGEPIGFPDKSQTTITFDSGIRTFSITPTGASFDVYCKGVKYTYTTVQLVTIPNTTGLHFIYFSASGVLSTQMSYFTWEEHAPTAYVYWNATTQQAIYFGDERHGITLDWQTHEYLHRTRGAAIANGFAASGYTTTGLGATDADAQIDIGGGTFFDEDMQVDIVSTNTPVAGTWQQDLSGPARIPVMYLSGAAWVIDSPTNFPFKVISSVPQYNLLSGSTWSTAGVTNNSYFVSWILATNNLTYPVISIISQAPTNQLSVAEAMTFEGLNLNGFPSVEFRPLYKVIYQYKDGFANSVKSSTIAVYDLRSISSAGVAAALVQDHGNLSGLTDDDHPQYVHTSEVRTPSAAVKNSFFPSQVGQTGKYLSTDGTNTVWEPAPSGSLSFTGDVTGSGSTGSSVAMTLAASGVVAGQYTKVTVDSKGRVTAGTGVTSADVTSALGYTPYNATNPAGYTTNVGTVTSVSGTGTVSGLTLTGSVTSSGSLQLGGTLSLTSGQVTTALGFTPYNATNPSGYITGITSGMVTTALGYTPYNSSNPSGYTNNTGTVTSVSGTGSVSGLTLTGTVTGSGSLTLGGTLSLTSGQVTTALGYTPPQPTGTGASGTWGINITGNAATTSQRNFTGDIASTGQGRFTGWYDGASGNNALATEVGVSGGASYILSYNRSTGTYGTLSLNGANIQLVPQGGSLTGPGGNVILHVGNYSSYALPLGGGTLTGAIYVGTTGSGSATRALRVGPSGGSPESFGSYSGSWRSTIEIWDNAATRMLHLTPPDGENYNWSSIKSVGAGLRIDVGGSGGTNAIDIGYNGVANFPQGLQQGGNQVLHAGNYTSYAPSLTGSGASGTWGISITGSANTVTNLNSVIQILSGGGGATFGSNHYSIGKDIANGSWSHPHYSDLIIGYHTGIRLGAAYSGIRFYNNSPTTDANNDGNGDQGEALLMTIGGYATGGSVNIVNDCYAYGYRGHSNVAGTGQASYHPAGIYSVGTNWLYGTIIMNGNGISGCGSINGSTPIHAGNYSSYALPLSGGTVTGFLGVGGNPGSDDGSWGARLNVGGNPHARIDARCANDGIVTTVYSHQGQNRGYVGTMSNHRLALGANGSEVQSVYSGYSESIGSYRAPIFYDSNDTSYYGDFSAGTALKYLRLNGDWGSSPFGSGHAQLTVTGTYASMYQTATNGSLGYMLHHIASDGSYYMYGGRGAVNGSSWDWGLRVLPNQDGNFVEFRTSARAPIFYDLNDTGYYLDPNGSTALFSNGLVVAGNSGFQSRTYVAGRNRIWSFNNADAYGISYFQGSGGIGGQDTFGVHFGNTTASGSVLQVNQLNYTTSTGSLRAPLFYDSDNTGYYCDPNASSYLYSLQLSGAGYFRTNNWIQLDGSYGVYWPNHYGAHFYPNAGSTYTQLQIDGSKNSYSGMYVSHSAVNGMMYDSGGNGGVYREANGRWYFYHHVGNNCMGIGTSSTSSSYYMYVGGGIYATGNVVAYSDARKKTNVATVDSALCTVSKLRGVFYNRIADGNPDIDPDRREIGVIAQEVNEVLPEVVTYAADVDEYGVQYGNFAGLFIEAFKELHVEVKSLRAEVQELRGRLSS